MLRLFLDANIIFAMVYSRSGASKELAEQGKARQVILFVNQHALDEANEVIEEEYPTLKKSFAALCQSRIFQFCEADKNEVAAAVSVVADPDDAPIIAAARKAKVDALVSFDRKHIHTPAVEKFINAPVITAGDALVMLRRSD